MQTAPVKPELSVIVACPDDTRGLDECLATLRSACPQDVEIVVVSSCGLSRLSRRSPDVRYLDRPNCSLVPYLWAAGVSAARGRLIATTTAHFAPSPTYCSSAIAAHSANSFGGIGGRIAPPTGMSPTAWAVYLLRYSPYLRLESAREISDFAGDNGVYRASALAPYLENIKKEGFWEHELHQRMMMDGERIGYDPSIEVRQIAVFSWRDFVRQRFRHGRIYGRRLAAEQALPRRIALSLRAGLVPALLILRTIRNVAAVRRHGGACLLALPAIAVFSTAWGLGEGLGCLTASRSPDEC